MKNTMTYVFASLAVGLLSLLWGGCGSEEAGNTPVADELLDESPGEEEGAEDELCLSHMDCYNEEEASGILDDLASVHAIPAPGSQCPVPEPYGYEKGERLENVELVDCEGNPFMLHDRVCGSTVSWVYFYRGPS